jgi:hypothetical protein
MLNVMMLSVIMLSVIMLSVIMLIAMVPFNELVVLSTFKLEYNLSG